MRMCASFCLFQISFRHSNCNEKEKRKNTVSIPVFFFQLIQHIKFDGWSKELVQNCWPTGQRHHLHLYRQWNQRWVLSGVHEQCPVIWRGMRQGDNISDDRLLIKPAWKYKWKYVMYRNDNSIWQRWIWHNLFEHCQVSNLFARDESDEILNDLVPIMKREFPKRPPTNENLYEYFMSRVQKNLHVVLCFSPVGEKFRNRALKFPALISGCTMDWFSRWPKDALVAGIVAIMSNLTDIIKSLLMVISESSLCVVELFFFCNSIFYTYHWKFIPTSVGVFNWF